MAFGLTRSGVLYANERMLVRNCTSFVVTPVHLVFTTTQHLLKFVHLTSLDGRSNPLIDLDYANESRARDTRRRAPKG